MPVSAVISGFIFAAVAMSLALGAGFGPVAALAVYAGSYGVVLGLMLLVRRARPRRRSPRDVIPPAPVTRSGRDDYIRAG